MMVLGQASHSIRLCSITRNQIRQVLYINVTDILQQCIKPLFWTVLKTFLNSGIVKVTFEPPANTFNLGKPKPNGCMSFWITHKSSQNSIFCLTLGMQQQTTETANNSRLPGQRITTNVGSQDSFHCMPFKDEKPGFSQQYCLLKRLKSNIKTSTRSKRISMEVPFPLFFVPKTSGGTDSYLMLLLWSHQQSLVKKKIKLHWRDFVVTCCPQWNCSLPFLHGSSPTWN